MPYRYAPVHFRFLRHFGRLYVNDDVSKMSTLAADPVARVGLLFHRLGARALGCGAVSPISPCCALRCSHPAISTTTDTVVASMGNNGGHLWSVARFQTGHVVVHSAAHGQ